jgi:hypothetical protein
MPVEMFELFRDEFVRPSTLLPAPGLVVLVGEENRSSCLMDGVRGVRAGVTLEGDESTRLDIEELFGEVRGRGSRLGGATGFHTLGGWMYALLRGTAGLITAVAPVVGRCFTSTLFDIPWGICNPSLSVSCA